MTHRLFPQLPRAHAAALATAHGPCDPATLRSKAASQHEHQIFSATGGRQVSRHELEELAHKVRELQASVPSRAQFDAPLTRLLHGQMELTRYEASLDDVWAFLGCVLLPDVVRWRFESSGATPDDRFTGASRGVRNVFGRCWWRGELLFDPRPPSRRDSYWLVDELAEDELTGIVERQRAISSRRVAVALARALVSANCRGIPRMNVARDAFKRYLRLAYFVEFDGLNDDELDIACQSLYRRSALALTRERTESE